MIRQTLQTTKEATFAVELPSVGVQGNIAIAGTGFFVSPDGWFVTAAHVVTQNGAIRTDLNRMYLSQPSYIENDAAHQVRFWEVECRGIDVENDVALFKVDPASRGAMEFLKGKTGFPFLEVSTRQAEQGEPVYTYGFPLPETGMASTTGPIPVSYSRSRGRVTSCIVSGYTYPTNREITYLGIHIYVLDKAFNPGNSGGPIIADSSGKVFAVCSAFQFYFWEQGHLLTVPGHTPGIYVPSLYGYAQSLSNQGTAKLFADNGITTSSD